MADAQTLPNTCATCRHAVFSDPLHMEYAPTLAVAHGIECHRGGGRPIVAWWWRRYNEDRSVDTVVDWLKADRRCGEWTPTS